MSARPGAITRFLIALVAITGAGAASAQDVPQVISPLRVETDQNGVNLVTGRMTMPIPTLSVPGAPNLRFDRVQNAAPYVSGRIEGGPGEIPQASYSIHAGGAASESFRCPDYDCESVTGTGSTFQHGTRVYRQAGSGARYTFNILHVDTAGPPRVLLYYASIVAWPNGETITYLYETAYLPDDPFHRPFRRPIRLTSNLGYYITISYQPGELGTMGWNSPAEAVIYASADPATPLGRLTYSGDTITQYGEDNQGSRTYTCTGCNNSLGADIEAWAGSLRLPGEGSNALTVTPVSGEHVVGSVTRDGVTWNYAYTNLRPAPPPALDADLFDRLTVTGPEGFNQVYEFGQMDQRNVIESVTDSIGRETGFTFDNAYRPTRIVAPELNAANVAYDPQGNIVSRTAEAKPGSGLADIVETAQYPEPPQGLPNACNMLCWRPTSARDALNRQTDFAYNASGQLTERTDPADREGVRRTTTNDYQIPGSTETTQTTMTGLGRRWRVRVCGTGAPCGTGAEIRTEYDYWRSTFLPLAERRIAGSTILTTRYDYDDAGRVTMTDGPLPGTDDATHYHYDDYGRKIWEIGPRGANGVRVARRHTYRDSDDRPVRSETGSVTDPLNPVLSQVRWTDHGYDSRRNLDREFVRAIVGTTTRTYAVVQRRYDDVNRLECEARRMNSDQFASSLLPADACDRDNMGDYGFDRITRYTYDAAGQMLREYRGWDVPSEQQVHAAYTYTRNGRRASVTDANGNRAELRYDGFDRLSYWVFPSPSTDGLVNEADYEEYRYDAAGNRIWLRKRDGSVLTYQYDRLDRMIRKTVPERAGLSAAHTRDVFYDYNARDLMTDARFDSWSGEGVGQGYDGFGRLISSSLNMDNVSRRLTYAWDAAGNRTLVTYPNNHDFTYAYDAAGRLTDLYDGDGATGRLFGFTYTPMGLPDVRTDPGAGGVDYNYDRLDRLSGIVHSFTGGTGNVTLGFTYNPASQIHGLTRDNDGYASSSAYDVSRPYSVNGLNQYTAAAGTTFGYDANGNLTRSGSTTYTYDVENRLVAASGGRSLRYDPLGRLYEVTGASGTRRYIHDGDALVAEYLTSGSLAALYVHGTGSGDDPLLWQGGGDNRRFHADHQGSIIAITNDGGTPQWINGYDAWGIPDAGNGGRFQYTGQIWLADFGLYHYKARIYSPTLGRFLQVDPVGYDDQINLYAYVGNDPVNHLDPTGLACDTGSRLGEAAQCRVHMDYFETGRSANGRAPRAPMAYGKGGIGLGLDSSSDTPGIGHNNPPPDPLWMRLARGFGRFIRAGGTVLTLPFMLGSSSCRTCDPPPDRPPGVPSNWIEGRARDGGRKWSNPENPQYNYVRERRNGQLIQIRNGQSLNVNGRPVLNRSPEAHYPRDQFIFRD